MRKKLSCILMTVLIFLISAAFSSKAYALQIPDSPSAHVIFVLDISGSVNDSDPEGYMRNAARLGIDLAPASSRIGFVAVSDKVISTYPLTDMSVPENRSDSKEYIASLVNNGNTDLLPGLEQAVEMLEASKSQQRFIVLLADFKEGGYNLSASPKERAEEIRSLSLKAASQNIRIDAYLIGSAKENSLTATCYQELPGASGGVLCEQASPQQLPALVESLYFENFSYFSDIYTLRGNSTQTLNIPMPTQQVRRARIYASATNPPQAFGALYSGGDIDGESSSSYGVADVKSPDSSGITVTITPGSSGIAQIYLLLEYGDISFTATPENHVIKAEQDTEEAEQYTTINTKIVDAATKLPLVSDLNSDTVDYQVTITKPDGQPLTGFDRNGFDYQINPVVDGFGTYTASATLISGKFTFSPKPVTFEIEDIRPAPREINWPLYLSIALSLILIITAVIFFIAYRKKESEYAGAVELASDYRFHGKLSVYAVMLDGGEREMRPFDFKLNSINEKRVSLREIIDSAGGKDAYLGAENILFLVGPEDSIVVRNNSQTIQLRIAGRKYGYRTKTQLFNGQKIYAIFEANENEIEITYRNIREVEQSPVRFNVSGQIG